MLKLVPTVPAPRENATPTSLRRTLRFLRPRGSDVLNAALDDVARFGRLPAYRRRQIERTIDTMIELLDLIDGDPDGEPEEDRGELDHLADDDVAHPLDALSLPVTRLFRREGRRHG